jgi:hypothetical protein
VIPRYRKRERERELEREVEREESGRQVPTP